MQRCADDALAGGRGGESAVPHLGGAAQEIRDHQELPSWLRLEPAPPGRGRPRRTRHSECVLLRRPHGRSGGQRAHLPRPGRPTALAPPGPPGSPHPLAVVCSIHTPSTHGRVWLTPTAARGAPSRWRPGPRRNPLFRGLGLPFHPPALRAPVIDGIGRSPQFDRWPGLGETAGRFSRGAFRSQPSRHPIRPQAHRPAASPLRDRSWRGRLIDGAVRRAKYARDPPGRPCSSTSNSRGTTRCTRCLG